MNNPLVAITVVLFIALLVFGFVDIPTLRIPPIVKQLAWVGLIVLIATAPIFWSMPAPAQ